MRVYVCTLIFLYEYIYACAYVDVLPFPTF